MPEGSRRVPAFGIAMVVIFGVDVSTDLLVTVVQTAIILASTFLVAVLIRKLFKRFIGTTSEKSAQGISRLLQGIVILIGLLAVVATLRVDISSLIIGLGAFSIAISFALSTIINNLVAGFLIQADGTVRVGDTISVGVIQGRVVRMRPRVTEVLTKEGSRVFIPNAFLVANPVINMGRAPPR